MNASFVIKNISFTFEMRAIFIKENATQRDKILFRFISLTLLTKLSDPVNGTAISGIPLSMDATLISIDRSLNSSKS